MTDTVETLYAAWLDQRTEELQKAAQALIQSDDPEAAFRAALNEPVQPEQPANPLFEGIDPSLIGGREDSLTLPDGRTVTRSQVQDFLSKYEGTITDGRSEDGPVVDGVRFTREQATEHLNRLDAEMREAAAAEKAHARAAFSADWAAGNANRR